MNLLSLLLPLVIASSSESDMASSYPEQPALEQTYDLKQTPTDTVNFDIIVDAKLAMTIPAHMDISGFVVKDQENRIPLEFEAFVPHKYVNFFGKKTVVDSNDLYFKRLDDGLLCRVQRYKFIDGSLTKYLSREAIFPLESESRVAYSALASMAGLKTLAELDQMQMNYPTVFNGGDVLKSVPSDCFFKIKREDEIKNDSHFVNLIVDCEQLKFENVRFRYLVRNDSLFPQIGEGSAAHGWIKGTATMSHD
jgi:hypothetical protein